MDKEGSVNLMINFNLHIDQISDQAIDPYYADEPTPQTLFETISETGSSPSQQEEEKYSCSLIGLNEFHSNGCASPADFLKSSHCSPALDSSMLEYDLHCHDLKKYSTNHCSILGYVSTDRLPVPDKPKMTYAS